MNIKGKTALVTGAARGIGQEICIALSQAGAKIVGADLDIPSLTETKKRVEATGGSFESFACDITSSEDVSQCVSFFDNQPLHILVNNAGVPSSGPYEEVPFPVVERTIEINLLGAMRLTHALLPVLKQSAPAQVISIASMAGKFGSDGLAAYAAAKHGIVGWSSSLRCEVAPHEVGVSWICPTFTQTRFLKSFRGNLFTPIITPENVAKAVVSAAHKNKSEVCLPASQQFFGVILPAIFPSLSRWVATRARMGGNWMELKRGPGWKTEK